MDDATRVVLEGEDASGPAFRSVGERLKTLEREAAQTTQKLAGSKSVFDELGKGIEEGFGRGLRSITAGMGPAARAATAAIVPLGAAAMAAATAAAAVGAAYNASSKELDGYRRALLDTGNAVGMTAGQMAVLAGELKGVTNTQSAAAEAITALAASGKVGAANLGRFAAVAVETQRTLGTSVATTVKQFAELGRAPTEASAKLTETHRYLTLEIYNQIRALEEQGRKSEAAALAQSEWARNQERIAAEVKANLGLIEGTWKGVHDWAKKSWDQMLGIGRGKSVEEQLAAAKKLLSDIESGGGEFSIGFTEKQIETQRARVKALDQLADASRKWAEFDKERVDAQQAGIEAQRANAKWADAALTSQQRLNKALDEYRRNNEKIRAAGSVLDPAQVKREEDAIRAKFAPKGKASREEMSDFQKYLEMLDKQLEKEAQLNAYEKLLHDVETGRLKNVSDEQLELLAGKARLIVATEAEMAAAEKAAAIGKVIADAQQRDSDHTERAIQQMKDQANAWLDQLDPMREFIRHIERVDEVVTELQKRGWGFTPEQIAAMKELGNGLKSETDKTKDAARELGLTFSSAFEDAIVAGGKLSDVLKGLEQDILRMITRKLVTEPLGNALTGSLNSDSGAIASILKLIFRADGGPVSAGIPYIVGERGPELYIPRTSGTIIPNEKLGSVAGGRAGDAPIINFNIQTPDVESFRRSEAQIAARLSSIASRTARFR